MITYRNFEAPDPHPQVTVITNNDNQNFGLEIMLPLKCLGCEHWVPCHNSGMSTWKNSVLALH